MGKEQGYPQDAPHCKKKKNAKNTQGVESHFKMARRSIFIGTPSIFESLILKQIDLYCKTIMT